MQTVGIMSMQRIYNYGSSLQAYALRKLIERVDPDATVSFVDYRPGPTLIEGPAAPRGKLTRAISKLREYNDVDARAIDKLRFFNHKRTYAAKYFPLVGITPEPNHNLNLDLQVIGSDEVFNCVQSNANVGYARDLFGHESAARRVISYAASFGNTTLEKVQAAGIRGDLAEDLARFSGLSVRDKNSSDIITAITGKRPDVHLDPTLVYNFANSTPKIPEERQHSEKYIIVYGYSGRLSRAENSAIRHYAQENDAKVLAFGGVQDSADEFIDCDPLTLLAYFRDASAVVTDTFHGTIFSVINEVPFATIIRPSVGHAYGNEEKLGYLLTSLGLTDRSLRAPDDLSRLLAEPVDYAPVRRIRDEAQVRTLQYLSSHAAVSRAEGLA